MNISDRPIVPIAVALVAMASAVWACDTPVYRYAMYNWSPAPYQVFYLHAGQPPGADREVNQELSRKERSAAVANVAFYSIDATGKDEFGQLPAPIQAAWKNRPAGAAAVHVVVNPREAVLFAGRLDKANLAALCDSPSRTRIGELLQQGHAAVLLVLECPDKQRTRAAQQAVRDAIAEVNAGRVGTAPPGNSPDVEVPRAAPAGNADSPAPRAPLKIASLTVSRADPAEAWLVRAILTVESDLGKYPDQPMVFAVYGRGQVLPPLVGKGITVDNLLDCVAFLGGACSCQVKDENPGVELPMRWDWQATAEAVAADDKDFDGGQGGYREVSAGVVAEKMAIAPASAAFQAGEGTGGSRNGPGEGGTKLAAADSSPHTLATRPSSVGGNGGPAPDVKAGLPDSVGGSRADKPPVATVSFVVQQAWIYGIGVASAAMAVVVAGLMLAHRKASSHSLP
jgi:hypothetical protein